MNQQRIDEIRERCEAATSAPWKSGNQYIRSTRENGNPQTTICEVYGNPVNNAEFISHARDDIPAIITVSQSAGFKDKNGKLIFEGG